MLSYNISLNIDVECDIFDPNTDTAKPIIKTISLILDLDIVKKMISRYEESVIEVGKYKIKFNYGKNNKPNMIALFDKDYMYLIKNPDHFVDELFKGYNTLIKLNTLIDISSFDFKSALQISEENIKDDTSFYEFDDDNDTEGQRYSAYI